MEWLYSLLYFEGISQNGTVWLQIQPEFVIFILLVVAVMVVMKVWNSFRKG